MRVLERKFEQDVVPDRPDSVLRFRESERYMHWALALPFLICYTTALILVFVYNPNPSRPFRAVFSWTHKLSGVCLIILPIAAAYYGRLDFRVHLRNIKCAWQWSFSDLRWLLMMGLVAISSRFSLPEQGKFNAAEKINFMVVLTTYPFFVLTGLLIWLPGVAIYSWLLHLGLALIATPLLFGHIFMATLNPGTRAGLQGMISGFVDRQWAKHHYRRWYQAKFEKESLDNATKIRCRSCDSEQPSGSWVQLLASLHDGKPLACVSCGSAIGELLVTTEPRSVDSLLEFLEGRAGVPAVEDLKESQSGMR